MSRGEIVGLRSACCWLPLVVAPLSTLSISAIVDDRRDIAYLP